jgi:hypothetical protein
MDLEKLLRDALVPCEPGPKSEVEVMARIASKRRRPRRLAIITSLLAMAAAAATLSVSLRHSTASVRLREVTAAEPPATPASGSLVEAAPGAAPVPSSELIQPMVADEPTSSTTAHGMRPVTIFVLPLQHMAVDERSKAAVELFYSSLLQGLSALPGLSVILDSLPPEHSRPRSDYRLTVKGGGALPGDKFQVVLVEGETKIADSRFAGSYIAALKGDIGNTCAAACIDPVSLAAQAVTTLVERGFLRGLPAAPSLPSDFERTEQYRLWSAMVEKDSPLESLLNAAYAGIDRGTWSYATLVMQLYGDMMTSPEDLETDRSLELDIQQALRELPVELAQGFKLWPAKCRLAMCSIQIAETAPGGVNVASNLLMKALRDKGLMSEDPKSPFVSARMPTAKSSSFWFLTRRDVTQAGAE